MKMISNMNKKEKIILFISIFFLVAIIGIGISFAYYTAVVLNGESKSSLISQAGNLEITYVDGEKQILGVSVFPGWQDSKTFTVKNTGDNAATYSIKVTNITNTFTIANSISLSLESSDGGKNMGKRTLPRNEATIVKYVSIDAGDMHTYTVTTYYNNLNVDQSDDKGKRFSYTIEVGASVGTNDTLISQSDTKSSTAKVFNGPITKDQVVSITFKNTNAVPSNAAASWDVSEAQNGSIMAYTLASGAAYNLYIGQEGGVTLGEDASYMFGYYSELLSNIDLTYLDTSNVTNMEGMFYNNYASRLDLSNFDTSNVTNMAYMFYKAVASDLDLSSFDTSKVTTMAHMFASSYTTSMNLSSFDTSSVTDMSGMFKSSSATNLDISKFDTSSVTDMSDMFRSSSATTLDVSSFNTSKVKNMTRMFSSLSTTNINGLDKLNTSSVTNMSYMFYNYPGEYIELPSFNTSKVTDMSYMFARSSKLDYIDLSSFDTTNVTDMTNMFQSIPLITGYARTSADAKRFNASTTGISTGIEFVVKS